MIANELISAIVDLIKTGGQLGLTAFVWYLCASLARLLIIGTMWLLCIRMVCQTAKSLFSKNDHR